MRWDNIQLWSNSNQALYSYNPTYEMFEENVPVRPIQMYCRQNKGEAGSDGLRLVLGLGRLTCELKTKKLINQEEKTKTYSQSTIYPTVTSMHAPPPSCRTAWSWRSSSACRPLHRPLPRRVQGLALRHLLAVLRPRPRPAPGRRRQGHGSGHLCLRRR